MPSRSTKIFRCLFLEAPESTSWILRPLDIAKSLSSVPKNKIFSEDSTLPPSRRRDERKFGYLEYFDFRGLGYTLNGTSRDVLSRAMRSPQGHPSREAQCRFRNEMNMRVCRINTTVKATFSSSILAITMKDINDVMAIDLVELSSEHAPAVISDGQ